MMRSEKDTARTGHKGCRCCYPVPDKGTLRKREESAWRKDNDDNEEGE